LSLYRVDNEISDVRVGLIFCRCVPALNLSRLLSKSRTATRPSDYNAEPSQSIIWSGSWQCSLDVFLMLEGRAPIAQNSTLQPVDEAENDIECIKTETKYRANDGAIAETV